MASEAAPEMDISVRISAAHHAPRRGQTKDLLSINKRVFLLFPGFCPASIRTSAGEVKASGERFTTRVLRSYDFFLPKRTLATAQPVPSFPRQMGVAALLVLTWSGALVAAPSLNGPYHSDRFGRLELHTEGGRLSARQTSGGVCKFAADRRMIEGEFEGNVLVGSVTLCREGPHLWNHFENQASEQGLFGGLVSGSVRVDLMSRLAAS